MLREERLSAQFELTSLTMAIVPVPYGSKIYSKVLEPDREYISPKKPLDLIKAGCRYYASSYSGRREGTKELIGVTHKAPIVIDPVQSIYFFPTASPKKADCAWISHEHVVRFHAIDRTKTEVMFQNGSSYVFPISPYSFENQMLRTALLRLKISQRFRIFPEADLRQQSAENQVPYRFASGSFEWIPAKRPYRK